MDFLYAVDSRWGDYDTCGNQTHALFSDEADAEAHAAVLAEENKGDKTYEVDVVPMAVFADGETPQKIETVMLVADVSARGNLKGIVKNPVDPMWDYDLPGDVAMANFPARNRYLCVPAEEADSIIEITLAASASPALAK